MDEMRLVKGIFFSIKKALRLNSFDPQLRLSSEARQRSGHIT